MAQETSQPKAETKVEPKPATAPAAVSTVVKIGDRQFELKNMTAEQGAELYALLPTDYRSVNFQAQADMFATMAANVHHAIQINLPKNVSPTSAVTSYFEFLAAGSGSLEKGAEKLGKKLEPWMKEIHKSMRPVLSQIPGAKTVNGTLDFSEVAMETWAGFSSTFAAPLLALFSALPTTFREGVGALASPYTPAQTKAFGAAMAGAMYEEARSRAEKPDTTISEEAGFFGKIAAGWEWLLDRARRIPVVGTLIQCIENICKDPLEGKNWSWSRAENEVKSLVAKPMPTYAELLQKQATAKVVEATHEAAFDKIRAAGEIAGIKTTSIVDLARNGGLYQAADTTQRFVKMEKGVLVEETIKNPQTGEPLKAGDRVVSAWKGTLGSFQDGVTFWEGAGAVGASAVALKYGPGAVSAAGNGVAATIGAARAVAGASVTTGTGLAQGFAQGVAGIAGGKEVRTSITMSNKLDDLVAKEAALTKQITEDMARLNELKAKDKPGFSERREIGKLKQELGIDAKEKFARDSARLEELKAKPELGRLEAWEKGRLEKSLAEGDKLAKGTKPYKLAQQKEAIAALEAEITKGSASSGGQQATGAKSKIAEETVKIAEKTKEAGEKLAAKVAGKAVEEVVVSASTLARLARWGGRVLGPAGTALGIGMSGRDVVNGVSEGDSRRITTGTTELLTVGGGAAAGATIGAAFWGVGAIPGAIIGAGLAGIASLGTGWGAGKIYDAIAGEPEKTVTQSRAATPSGSTGTPDPGLAAAATRAEQNAQKARDQARYAMAGTKSTMLGAVHSVADGSTVQSSKVAFMPVAAAPISFDFA